jgi:hypothetical protein
MESKPKEKNNHPTQPHWREMNRKQRRKTMRKIQSEDLSLELVHRDAAGIDIGNESHYVAVPPSRDNQPVRRFGCTTAELKAMAACGLHRYGLNPALLQPDPRKQQGMATEEFCIFPGASSGAYTDAASPVAPCGCLCCFSQQVAQQFIALLADAPQPLPAGTRVLARNEPGVAAKLLDARLLLRLLLENVNSAIFGCIANYIIGSQSAGSRFALWFDGIHGSRAIL